MVNARDEFHLQGLEGIAIWHGDVHIEGAALVRGAFRAGKGADEVEGRV